MSQKMAAIMLVTLAAIVSGSVKHVEAIDSAQLASLLVLTPGYIRLF